MRSPEPKYFGHKHNPAIVTTRGRTLLGVLVVVLHPNPNEIAHWVCDVFDLKSLRRVCQTARISKKQTRGGRGLRVAVSVAIAVIWQFLIAI